MLSLSQRYMHFIKKKIKEILLQCNFDPYNLIDGYGFGLDERIIEYPWLFARLPFGDGTLLDAGSVLNFKYILTQKSLLNKKIFISTLSPEKVSFWKRSISYIYEDMRDICYKDNYFDYIVSLSVIEHIGLDNTKFYTKDKLMNELNQESYLLVVDEMRRVLKENGTLYLSMPFGKNKNYGWLQTFNSDMIDAIIETFSPVSYKEYHYKYTNNGWITSTREMSADCNYYDYHNNKITYIRGYPIAAEAIVCLEMKK